MQISISKKSPIQAIREFLQLESAGGIILIFAATLAILMANSPLDFLYAGFLDIPIEVRVDTLKLAKPLLLWINDGLMAIFFLLIGLEVKREILEGQLSRLSQVALPGIAAVGGMVVPALIYVWFNQGNTIALNGWAIPAATDIAFALGIVALLGKRVPQSLKIFLLTLAILDDLAAIGIIAIFYTSDLSLTALVLAAIAVFVLIIFNRLRVTRIAAYMIIGVILWVLVLKSGVHATLAGVAVAFAIPMRAKNGEGYSPIKHLEHALHPWVAYMILPLFAFANAGLDLGNLSLDAIFEPVPLGIILGLFLGKSLGIFGTSWLAIKTGMARLPEGSNWGQLYGIAQMCGVGFTMSLFIAGLAFEHESAALLFSDRLGILTGSLLSALWGYLVLRITSQIAESEPLSVQPFA